MVFNQPWLARFQPSTLSTPSPPKLGHFRTLSRTFSVTYPKALNKQLLSAAMILKREMRLGATPGGSISNRLLWNNFCPYKLSIMIHRPEFSGHFGNISPKVAGMNRFKLGFLPPPSHSHPPIPLQNVRFKNLKLFRFPFKSSFPKFNQLQRNN